VRALTRDEPSRRCPLRSPSHVRPGTATAASSQTCPSELTARASSSSSVRSRFHEFDQVTRGRFNAEESQKSERRECLNEEGKGQSTFIRASYARDTLHKYFQVHRDGTKRRLITPHAQSEGGTKKFAPARFGCFNERFAA